MNKPTSHLVLGLLDLASIYGAWVGWFAWQQLKATIATGANTIEFQWPLCVYCLLVIIPILHLTSLLSGKQLEKWHVSRLLIGLFAGLIGFVIYANTSAHQQLAQAGYTQNQTASKSGTVSRFLVYELTGEPHEHIGD